MSKQKYIIVFVDDEPWSNQPLRLALEARGFECESFTNMTDAWAFISDNPVDVVVTDVMMPAGECFQDVDSSVTGFQLIKKIRSVYSRLPVICLSVIGDQTKINALKHQGVLYLRKGETSLEKARKLIESQATGLTSFG